MVADVSYNTQTNSSCDGQPQNEDDPYVYPDSDEYVEDDQTYTTIVEPYVPVKVCIIIHIYV